MGENIAVDLGLESEHYIAAIDRCYAYRSLGDYHMGGLHQGRPTFETQRATLKWARSIEGRTYTGIKKTNKPQSKLYALVYDLNSYDDTPKPAPKDNDIDSRNQLELYHCIYSIGLHLCMQMYTTGKFGDND
jgi:hypothetical protein